VFPSIFRYIPCSRKVSSHLIKAVAFYENSEIGGVFVTIRFVRVAERILINLIVMSGKFEGWIFLSRHLWRDGLDD